jgi:hypothetical protein
VKQIDGRLLRQNAGGKSSIRPCGIIPRTTGE